MGRPPYQPVEPEGIFDGLQWPFIIRGALLDIVLTLVGTIVLMSWLVGPEVFSGDEELIEKAFDEVARSPSGLFGAAALGTAATAAGGYYAARHAGALFSRHGGWVGAVSLLLAVPFLLVPSAHPPEPLPFWYDALSYAVVVPAGCLGGLLASRRS